MSELKLSADSGGGSVSFKGPSSTTSNAAVQLVLPVADGSANQLLKTDGSGNLGWKTESGLTWTTGSAVSASGESDLDVTGIPSTAVMVVVHFIGISTASSSTIYFRVGTSSGLITTGDKYDYASGYLFHDGSDGSDQNDEKIRLFRADSAAASVRNGNIMLCKAGDDFWTFQHNGGHEGNGSGFGASAGSIEVGGDLDRIRLICNSGNFDAGSMYVSYLA